MLMDEVRQASPADLQKRIRRNELSDRYDRIYGQLHTTTPMTRPTTIVDALPIAGNVLTWIVQTAIDREDRKATVFLQAIDAEGQLRVVLPSKVVAAIIRQDKALRDRLNERGSEETRRIRAEQDKVKQARALLERKRQERRARREAQG